MVVPVPKLTTADLFKFINDIRRDVAKLQKGNNVDWVTAGVATSVSPHTVTAQRVKLLQGSVSISLAITLGAAITVGSDGNVADTTVAQVLDPFQPNANQPYVQNLISISSPFVAGFINNSGQIVIATCVPGGLLPSGSVIVLGGVYLQ